MKKLFISADIEGTCGITNWDEAEKNHYDYAFFARQMSREVAAACAGARESGFESILVKDAHDTGRNIDHRELPEYVELFRGGACHPYRMMYGLSPEFDGVVFTGYHSAAFQSGNNLAHTMNMSINHLTINGETASELMINCLLAADLGIPVFAVIGDKALCDWISGVNPHILTFAANDGYGKGTRSVHPDVALRKIKDVVQAATAQSRADCLYPLPSSFVTEVSFKEGWKATQGSFYPGATKTNPRTIRYESSSYFEVLRFFHFVL